MLNDFFKKLIGTGKPTSSKDTAKKRLKFALIYDKLDISEETLQALHRDMVEVISRYFEIDGTNFKLDIHRSDDLSALVVNTPILGPKSKGRV